MATRLSRLSRLALYKPTRQLYLRADSEFIEPIKSCPHYQVVSLGIALEAVPRIVFSVEDAASLFINADAVTHRLLSLLQRIPNKCTVSSQPINIMHHQ